MWIRDRVKGSIDPAIKNADDIVQNIRLDNRMKNYILEESPYNYCQAVSQLKEFLLFNKLLTSIVIYRGEDTLLLSDKAVSYTHLDVYKRQGKKNGVLIHRRNHFCRYNSGSGYSYKDIGALHGIGKGAGFSFQIGYLHHFFLHPVQIRTVLGKNAGFVTHNNMRKTIIDVYKRQAFATKEALYKRAVIVFENISGYLEGRPQNVM